MCLLSSSTLHIHQNKKGNHINYTILCVCKIKKTLKTVNSHGLEDGAGEVLGAEAGEELNGNVRQEGHQLQLEPELDEVRVFQVALGHRRRVRLAKDLLKVVRHLLEVLHEVKIRQQTST